MVGLKTYLKKWKREFHEQGAWDKLTSNLATARPGTRAFPNRSKDHAIDARLDFGGTFVDAQGEQFRNLDLQPNKGAKDPNMATLAKKNSHQKLASVAISVDHPPSEEDFLKKLSETLENNRSSTSLRRSRSLSSLSTRK